MITRRGFLRGSAMAAAGTVAVDRAGFTLPVQNQTAPATPAAGSGQNALQMMRIAGGNTPVQVTKLTDTIFLLRGVGGNMVVQFGPDGRLLIDSSVATAAPAVLRAVEKLGAHPLRMLINTCWLFDHTDGNAAMHAAGAFIIAQENTRQRLSTAQTVNLLNLSLPAAPTEALPQLTFPEADKLYINNDELDMVHTPNAHTDSDIFIHFVNANVIHAGDLWFNSLYPFIDESSDGSINGLIRAVDQILALADDRTKIVPGHGQPGDKRALQKYRDMLSTVANRVEKLKISGQTLQQVVAAKPTSDLDAGWAHGMMTPEMFVAAIYDTL